MSSALVDRPIRTVPGQVVTPDDWLVHLWYRPFKDKANPQLGYGSTQFKAVGVSAPKKTEKQAAEIAFRALGIRRPEQVLDLKVERLFKSAYFRRKGERHPALQSAIERYI